LNIPVKFGINIIASRRRWSASGPRKAQQGTKKSIILHHKCQCIKPFGVLMTNKEPFCASLRLIRTVFTRLKIKVRRRACPERSRRGLYSFAFSLKSYGISSTKEQVRKNNLFMQNKANFRKVKFNVNRVLTKDYDQMDTWSIRKTKPIQSQLKPIKANSKPIKANQSQFKANSKPIKANQSQFKAN
jgi:hypothetical protein